MILVENELKSVFHALRMRLRLLLVVPPPRRLPALGCSRLEGKRGSWSHRPGAVRQVPTGGAAESLSCRFTWRISKPRACSPASMRTAAHVWLGWLLVCVSSNWSVSTRRVDSSRIAVPMAWGSYPSTSALSRQTSRSTTSSTRTEVAVC
eukprot:scaffold32124_cov77-Phaeocystis_antarctica.AAC.6